jgi:hypothetical protein
MMQAAQSAADEPNRSSDSKGAPRTNAQQRPLDRPLCSLREALADPALLGSSLAGESWVSWRAMLIAMMGEPLTPEELELFRRFTGRSEPPPGRIEEAALVIGRRGGKDRAAATLASYIAAFVDWSCVLAPGERGMVICIGPDQRQAKITLSYIEGVFRSSPVIGPMVANRTAHMLELCNGISIEVRSASFRRIRGTTAVAVVATETAFWHSEDANSANPDTEILNAVRPALATTGGPLIMISSPYAKRGELWEIYRRHFGPAGDPLILVAQGTTRDFNPSLSERIVNRALERDHAAASAEYLAQFRQDLEAFVSVDVVRSCVEVGTRERAPLPNVRYVGFVDPSGGSQDSMALAIAHLERGTVMIDVLREVRPPFSPDAIAQEFGELLRSYRVHDVTGDRYGGEWPRERFAKHGVRYRPADRTKSQLFQDLLPRLNAGTVRLPDNERLVAQLAGLERRVSRGGQDSISHAPGGHDDIANVVAGAAALVTRPAVPVAVVGRQLTLRGRLQAQSDTLGIIRRMMRH